MARPRTTARRDDLTPAAERHRKARLARQMQALARDVAYRLDAGLLGGNGTGNQRLRSTAGHIRMMRHAGIAKKPRKRLPRQIPPKAIERSYGAALQQLVAVARRELQQLVDALPNLMASAAAARRIDGFDERLDADESKRVRELVAAARARIAASVTARQAEALAQRFADQTANYQAAQLSRQLVAALGVNPIAQEAGLSALAGAFVESNIGLITNLTDGVATDIEGLALRAIQGGKLHGDIAEELSQRFAMADRRATLIARDQVGKFYGQVNATRQRSLGIRRFVWMTVGDERVRDEHEERDGETYDYDDPPDGELPGEPIQCRCWAEPVVDDILDEASDDGGSGIFGGGGDDEE